MAIHRQSCPKEVINCPYSNVGCTHSAEREIIEEHVKENTELHLNIAVKKGYGDAIATKGSLSNDNQIFLFFPL